MKTHDCAFALPGDPDTRTGGYIYDRELIAALRATGRSVPLIRAPESFPHPSPADEAEALQLLRSQYGPMPVILDGLLFGALPTEGVAALKAPLIALTHHPLGLEPGLAPARARALIARERANLQLAAHVVVPSPHVARILVAEFGLDAEKISVALPGFNRPTAPERPKDGPPLILSVGLICARKGHDVLIDALARIAHLDWRAEIVGPVQDPALLAALHCQVKRLGLSGRVHFAGAVADATLQDLYARATIFALATRYEGYGMVFGEALLNGLPIVSCASGAVSDTVPEGAGRLVASDDPAAFAAALGHLLRDPVERAACAAAARRAGANLPGWTDTAAVMAGVIDRVAKSG